MAGTAQDVAPARRAAVSWRRHAIALARSLGPGLDRTLEWLLVALLLSSLAVTLLQVFLRYFMSSPLNWSEEFSRLAFLWLVFVGGAVAVRRGTHITIDTCVGLLPPLPQRVLGLFVNLMVALTAVVLLGYGWQLLASLDASSAALRWPMWVFYGAVPAGAALMLLNLLRQRMWDRGGYLASLAVIGLAGALVYAFFAMKVVPPPQVEPGSVVVLSFLLLLLLGVPVAFSLALGALLGYWVAGGGAIPFTALPHQMANGVDSFLLLAVPFFILAGEFMNAGGITKRLVDVAAALVGHWAGGLAHVNILTNTFMGGMSGSSAADAAAIGKVLIAGMERRGYARTFSCAVTSAASLLANIIPPSITMMIYASIIDVSVGRLFLAGILPGVLLAALMMVMAHVISKKRGYRGLERRATLTELGRAMRSAAWAFGMPVIIVGGMVFGVTTPTEAAGVAALYALAVGALVYRELKWRMLPELIVRAAMETAIIILILGASDPFAWILTAERIPQALTVFVVGVSANPLMFLLLVNVLLLLVGLPLEPTPALVILMPIIGPMLPAYGINPVHFGIVVIVNLLLGALTPPVGTLVFITSALGKVPPAKVFQEVIPFILISLVGLVLITYLPPISLFLPNLLMGAAK